MSQPVVKILPRYVVLYWDQGPCGQRRLVAPLLPDEARTLIADLEAGIAVVEGRAPMRPDHILAEEPPGGF